MTFIQTITVVTDQIGTVEDRLSEWISATAGRRTARRVTVTADRDDPNTHMLVIEFPSYEAATENSQLPETGQFAIGLADLCIVPPVFHNFDIRRTDVLAD